MKKRLIFLMIGVAMCMLSACGQRKDIENNQADISNKIDDVLTSSDSVTSTEDVTDDVKEEIIESDNITEGFIVNEVKLLDLEVLDFEYDYTEDIAEDVKTVISKSTTLQEELDNIDLLIQKYTPLAQSATTQMEMNISSRWFYVIWDTELNQLWSRFSEKADAETKQRVLEEQRKWVSLKDEAASLYVGSSEENGSMYPMLINTCLEEITKKRAYVLANELATIMDEAFTLPEISNLYGTFMDNQGTEECYSELITRQGFDGGNEAIIGIYRLTTLEGTFEVVKEGELQFSASNLGVKGIIRINGWEGASFEVTEVSDTNLFSVGDIFQFPMAF